MNKGLPHERFTWWGTPPQTLLSELCDGAQVLPTYAALKMR